MAIKKNTPPPEQSDFQEPEETIPPDAETVGDIKDVLTEDQVIGAKASGAGSDQPQKEWTPPPPGEGPAQDPNQDAGKQQQEPTGGQPFTPPPGPDEWRDEGPGGDIPGGTKYDGCLFIANKLVDLWSEGKRRVGNMVCLISERKLERLHEKGEIDLNAPIYLNYATQDGTPLKIHYTGAIRNFNLSVKDKFGISPETRAEVVPILTGILMRKNIAATPETQLLVIFVGDTIKFIEIMSDFRSMQRDLIDAMRENTAMWREAGSPKTEPPAATVVNPEPPPPPKPPPPAEEPVQPQPEWTPPPPKQQPVKVKLIKPHKRPKRKPTKARIK